MSDDVRERVEKLRVHVDDLRSMMPDRHAYPEQWSLVETLRGDADRILALLDREGEPERGPGWYRRVNDARPAPAETSGGDCTCGPMYPCPRHADTGETEPAPGVEPVEFNETARALADDIRTRGMCGALSVDGWGRSVICILPSPCERHPPTDTGETEARDLRKRLEDAFPTDDGFTEAFDALLQAGLIVPVPADDAFKAEWGDDQETMWVWKWLTTQGGDR